MKKNCAGCWWLNLHSNKIGKYGNEQTSIPQSPFVKKIIATNNPNIDTPKVVDEIDTMREILVDSYLEKIKDVTKRFFWKVGFKHGYNKSQETHPFSEEDMIEFILWKDENKFSIISTKEDWVSELLEHSGCVYTSKELLRLWKEQQTKIVYYNG